jgi:long-chain acyl-CoA synthetase
MGETNQTGYPSIDKPWLKYYNKEITSKELPPQKIYDYIAEVADSHMDSYCLEYFGKKITYKAFLENVEKVAKAFLTLDVQDGDIVSVIAPTTPESIYCIYALNRIGAVANLIDPRLGTENLAEKTKCSNIIVSIDLVKNKVDSAVEGCKTVIYFSVAESFPPLPNLVYKMKSFRNKQPQSKNAAIEWKDFLKRSEHVSQIMDTPYRENATAVVVSTSGTTGKSKLACITNENMNVVAYQYAVSGLISEQKFGDTFLNIMPIFLAYGVVSGVHMALSVGFKSVIIPQRELDKMGRYLLKYKPQYYLDTPGG